MTDRDKLIAALAGDGWSPYPDFVQSPNFEDRRNDSAVTSWGGGILAGLRKHVTPTMGWPEIKLGLQNPMTHWRDILAKQPEAYPVTPLGVEAGILDMDSSMDRWRQERALFGPPKEYK